jgi:hypothetical protein
VIGNKKTGHCLLKASPASWREQADPVKVSTKLRDPKGLRSFLFFRTKKRRTTK